VIELQGNIDQYQARLIRIMGEYNSNMFTLDQRLQIIEQLAEERQRTTIMSDRPKKKKSLNLIGISTSEDGV
jgi:hypothetical protein